LERGERGGMDEKKIRKKIKSLQTKNGKLSSIGRRGPGENKEKGGENASESWWLGETRGLLAERGGRKKKNLGGHRTVV